MIIISLDSVLKQINKEHDNIAFEGFRKYDLDNKIKFSSPPLNYMTYGGLPRGRLIELSGQEGDAKSTTALDLCKNASKIIDEEGKGQKILYVDAENTLDPIWATKIFPDFNNYVIVIQPQGETAEEIFQIILDLIDTGEIMLCVLDSLAVLFSDADKNKEMEGVTYAGISASLTKFTKFIVPMCMKYNCTFIGINQMRDNLTFMGGMRTTGGRAWKHNCTVRLELRRYEFFNEKREKLGGNAENPYGHTVKVALKKSKSFPSNRKLGIFTLTYLDGIDIISDTIDTAIQLGFISKAGAWYEVINKETGEIIEGSKQQGLKNMRNYLTENKEIYDELYNQVIQEVSGNKGE